MRSLIERVSLILLDLDNDSNLTYLTFILLNLINNAYIFLSIDNNVRNLIYFFNSINFETFTSCFITYIIYTCTYLLILILAIIW